MHDSGVSDFYLPTPLAIIFVYWLGPKYVLPALFFNSVLTSHLWGNPPEQWQLWFVFAIPETFYVFLSWFLFKKVNQGKFWLPDIHNTILFLSLGIFIPAVIEAFSLQTLLVWTNVQSIDKFWGYFLSNFLSEFTTTFFLTLPALYYITPFLKKKGWAFANNPKIRVSPQLNLKDGYLLFLMFLLLIGLSFMVEFIRYWYIYGIFSLIIAVRRGFGPALLSNLLIVVITYILPKLFQGFGENTIGDYQNVNELFLGANLLFVFAAITGRVISDMRKTKKELMKQNLKLEQTNKELDRFVYSVSHDLSAPLKSILGLVNISKLSANLSDHQIYMSRIEESVIKLEEFIAEVLDYSRSQRVEISTERILLNELFDELIKNHCFALDSHKIHFYYDFQIQEVWQDKTRLKIILNNLLSNAIKFQKSSKEHYPYIKISSRKSNSKILIKIEDNGQGIKPEYKSRIFEMFFRGNEKSGSGLGLFIAKEAANHIGADIYFNSTLGKGSTFTLAMSLSAGKGSSV